MIDDIPLPSTDDPLDRVFWENARHHRLVVQACASCGDMRFPPRPMCPHCQSEDVVWEQVSGEGVVWSFASPRTPLLPAFEALTPYVTIIGALKENPQIRMAGMAVRDERGEVTGVTANDVTIGQPIRIQFRQVSEDCTLPFWRLGTRTPSPWS